jgi:hypothetical protein
MSEAFSGEQQLYQKGPQEWCFIDKDRYILFEVQSYRYKISFSEPVGDVVGMSLGCGDINWSKLSKDRRHPPTIIFTKARVAIYNPSANTMSFVVE